MCVSIHFGECYNSSNTFHIIYTPQTSAFHDLVIDYVETVSPVMQIVIVELEKATSIGLLSPRSKSRLCESSVLLAGFEIAYGGHRLLCSWNTRRDSSISGFEVTWMIQA